MHPLLLDPFVAAEIDAVLEKHRHALTPEQIEAFREKMAWTFVNHPTASRILERARASQAEISGEVRVDGAQEPPLGKQGGGEGA